MIQIQQLQKTELDKETLVNKLLEKFIEYTKLSILKDNWINISTSIPGIFNDYIEVYLKIEGERVIFSDDSETCSRLQLLGVDILNNKAHKKIAETIMSNYGVKLDPDNEEITLSTDINNLAEAYHKFLMALKELNDLEYLSYLE